MNLSVLSKIHFMQWYRRRQLVHLKLWGWGIWCIVPLKRTARFQQPALFYPLCMGWICRGSISLMKITFIPTRLLLIQLTLCNRWALVPECLNLISFLKQDQTRKCGWRAGWCEFDEFSSKNIHFSLMTRMTNKLRIDFWRISVWWNPVCNIIILGKIDIKMNFLE